MHDLGGAAPARPRPRRRAQERAGRAASPTAGPTTSRPSSTPPAPRARPRAWCRRTATTSPRSTSSEQTTAASKEGDVHLLFLPLAHSFARLESFLGVLPRPHHGVRREHRQAARQPAGDAARTSSAACRASSRRSTRGSSPRAEAGSPLKKKIFHWAVGVGREVSRHSAARPAGAGRPRLQAPPRPQARLLEAARARSAGGCASPCRAARRCPGDRRVLPRGRHPDPRGLRAHRDVPGAHLQPRRTTTSSARWARRCRASSSRSPPTARSSGRGRQHRQGLLQEARGDRGGVPAPTAGSPPATSARIDEDGFLFITDRKKDLIVTAGGMNIAPQNIENLLKGDPFISQVMVHGDRRPYPVALITLNPEELAKFAQEQGILNADPAALAKHPKVIERVSRTWRRRTRSCSPTPRSRSSRSCRGLHAGGRRAHPDAEGEAEGHHRAVQGPARFPLSIGRSAAASPRRQGRRRHRREPRSRSRDGGGAGRGGRRRGGGRARRGRARGDRAPGRRRSGAARSSCRPTSPTTRQVEALMARTVGELGRLDVVVNNSGIAQRRAGGRDVAGGLSRAPSTST